MNYKEKLKLIIKHYKVLAQLKYFQSEVYELTEAIINEEDRNKFNPFNPLIKAFQPSTNCHITEEIADVMVMLMQFQLYYDISTEDIKTVMKRKIDRQIERINKENETSKEHN